MKAEDEATYWLQIKDELIKAEDEVIISRYLKRMIVNGDSWPDHFIEDVDVFNTNPDVEFYSPSTRFLIVKTRTEACGRTDGCESGCWRIIGRDKLIKSKETGKILGFKKILKFCKKTKPREYKRSWVMEEYRLTNNLNSKQDHVICKIRFLFEAEISFLLAKQFSYLSTRSPRPANQLLPAYGVCLFDTEAEGAFYLQKIIDYDDGNTWPSYVTNDVYRLHPLTLVDPQDDKFKEFGTCIFANRTKACGKTDECDGGGYWTIVEGHRGIKSKTGEILGYSRVFQLSENEEPINVCEGEDVKEVAWIIEEYRLDEKKKKDKVLCIIKKILIPLSPR
ncbi:NAC domain [Arabidopsis thaliana x Arabidopsis arenosa]|uniref:NAC domain n=1 Tax=Arabidopsis thaliana x Arabidopsis arenosa TaxID=1240361 RepID=A0A8T2BJ94_9BRAS|nr:NAC domain [Arabidopsis thaliana x Arabidopsis arenosa]